MDGITTLHVTQHTLHPSKPHPAFLPAFILQNTLHAGYKKIPH